MSTNEIEPEGEVAEQLSNEAGAADLPVQATDGPADAKPEPGDTEALLAAGEPKPDPNLPGNIDFPTGHESATMSGEHSPALDERGVAQSGFIDPADAGKVENAVANAEDPHGAMAAIIEAEANSDDAFLARLNAETEGNDQDPAVDLDDVLAVPEPLPEPEPDDDASRHAPGPTLPANFDHAAAAALRAAATIDESPADRRWREDLERADAEAAGVAPEDYVSSPTVREPESKLPAASDPASAVVLVNELRRLLFEAGIIE